VRSVAFGAAFGIVTRSEALVLADVFVNSSGKLTIREQGCWSGAYRKGNSDNNDGTIGEDPITELAPEDAAKVVALTTELDLTQAENLAGAKEWVRPKQSPAVNALGWRRGRPSYCPARTSPTDEPAASQAAPGFAPSPDPYALGAQKPWLNGGTCLCPEQEVKKRGLCSGQTGAALATCIDEWTQNSLPHAPGGPSPDSDVTDCRVIDEESDTKPGMTGEVDVGIFGKATIKSAASLANILWGKIDLSAAKQHWGVSLDLPELQNAAVACSGSALLCDQSTGDLCPGYPEGATPTKENRINPVDFALLDNKTPPAGGWTCQAIYDAHMQGSLFGGAVSWSTKYPMASQCD
jgi:hypothetical protein